MATFASAVNEEYIRWELNQVLLPGDQLRAQQDVTNQWSAVVSGTEYLD